MAAFELTGAPLRWTSLAVSTLSLVALVVGELGARSVIARSTGSGGIEHRTVYPIGLWPPFSGGHLVAESTKPARPAGRPGSIVERNPQQRGEEAAA